MATASAKTVKPPSEVGAIPWSRLYQLTVDQFERMTEKGILTAADRVELLEGWIVRKVTQNPAHCVSIDCTHEALRSLLPSAWSIRQQMAIRLISSMPEPDLAIVKAPLRRYATRHPRPRDIGGLIEVADATLAEDRKVKGPIYARARIPLYWIVNLIEAKVEVYSRPRGGRKAAYVDRQDYGKDEMAPLVLEGIELGSIPVRDLLP